MLEVHEVTLKFFQSLNKKLYSSFWPEEVLWHEVSNVTNALKKTDVINKSWHIGLTLQNRISSTHLNKFNDCQMSLLLQ